MGKISDKSTFSDPIGLLEDLLKRDISVDTLQIMRAMIQDKLDEDVELYVGEGLHICRVCESRYTDNLTGICGICARTR